MVLASASEVDRDPGPTCQQHVQGGVTTSVRQVIVIPELDRGAWFSLADVSVFIRYEQRTLLMRLQEQFREDRLAFENALFQDRRASL